MATEHLHRYTPKQLAVLPINGMSRSLCWKHRRKDRRFGFDAETLIEVCHTLSNERTTDVRGE